MAAQECLLAQSEGIPHQKWGCIWWEGDTQADGLVKELAKDLCFPIIDLSKASVCSAEDALFTYASCDINAFSTKTGISWAAEKMQAFSTCFFFLSFEWDLDLQTIAVEEQKQIKYLAGLREWQHCHSHNRMEAEILLGRLQHLTFVVCWGHPYLVTLAHFLCLYGKDLHNSDHKQLTPS
jgi:hypothetical protein